MREHQHRVGPERLGHGEDRARNVSGFGRVTLDGVGHLTIAQTGTESLSITTDDNLLPHIDSTVSGGTLHLGPTSGTSIGTVTRLDYQLTVKSLDALNVSGAATIDATAINTAALTVTLSGAGAITISGQADSQDVELSGAGAYRARAFATKTASIRVSGAGGAEVAVSDRLDVHVSGAGGVTYHGSPSVTQSISGVGSVKKG